MAVETPKPELLAALFEGSSDGLTVVEDGRYVYANPAWAGLLGRAPAELVGRSVDDDVHPDFRTRLHAWLAEDGRAAVEFSFVRADSSIAIFHLSPIRSAVGHGFIARDLTAVKRLQAKQLLADRMMSVGALAAGVAHEINNPLSYVLGNLTYLGEECDTIAETLETERQKELHEAMSEALEGAERIRGIVAGLQAFARADRETLQPTDVNVAIESAIHMAWIEIRHRARLVKALNPDVPAVIANEATFGQVILSLLLNAAHALPVGKAADNEIRIETRTEGERVVVEISDSGPGIPQDVVRHVFDTFFADDPPGIGSGLALSIAHTVVTEMGGTIGVESRPGRTSYKVVLPPETQSAPPAAAEPAPPQDAARSGHKRILVVDDEPLLVSSVRRALREHDVHTVTSGRDAITLLERDADFDLVFCDLYMADTSGMDVYNWVHEHRPGLQEHIVFMTGHIYNEDVLAFLERLPNKRISKPFELQVIRRFVTDYVR